MNKDTALKVLGRALSPPTPPSNQGEWDRRGPDSSRFHGGSQRASGLSVQLTLNPLPHQLLHVLLRAGEQVQGQTLGPSPCASRAQPAFSPYLPGLHLLPQSQFLLQDLQQLGLHSS